MNFDDEDSGCVQCGFSHNLIMDYNTLEELLIADVCCKRVEVI